MALAPANIACDFLEFDEAAAHVLVQLRVSEAGTKERGNEEYQVTKYSCIVKKLNGEALRHTSRSRGDEGAADQGWEEHRAAANAH